MISLSFEAKRVFYRFNISLIFLACTVMQVAQCIIDGARVATDGKGQAMPPPDFLTQIIPHSGPKPFLPCTPSPTPNPTLSPDLQEKMIQKITDFSAKQAAQLLLTPQEIAALTVRPRGLPNHESPALQLC